MGRAVTELDEIRYMDIVQLTSINQEASRTKRRHIDTEVVGALDPDAKFPIVEHWYEDGRVTMTVGLDCEWCGVIETTLDSFKGLPIHVVGA